MQDDSSQQELRERLNLIESMIVEGRRQTENALAISLFLLFLALGVSGRLTHRHVFVAVISAILGMANGASALILRWRVQLACAVVWWAAAVAGCFGRSQQSMIVFLTAIFICQIVFGAYGMAIDAQKGRARVHA